MKNEEHLFLIVFRRMHSLEDYLPQNPVANQILTAFSITTAAETHRVVLFFNLAS
jgi:hypothetical protein